MLRLCSGEPLPRLRLARTLASRPLYQVSVYVVGDTLVDSGPPATARELLAWARSHGIRRVVHTHHHEDHTGGDALLARHLGVTLEAPATTTAKIAHWYRIPLYRRFTWGQPKSVRARPLASSVELGGHTFELVPTPGHADDHVALWDAERGWLFSGDLYVAPRIRYLRREENAWQQIASLQRLRDLAPRLMLCAHAGPVTEPAAALEERIRYWCELADRARELAAAGLSRAHIRRRLLGKEGFLTLASGGDFSKGNLLRSLLDDRPE